jgi:hypothetical protein
MSTEHLPPDFPLILALPCRAIPRRASHTVPNFALLVFVMITVQPQSRLTNWAIDYLNAETARQDHLANLWAKALRQGINSPQSQNQ